MTVITRIVSSRLIVTVSTLLRCGDAPTPGPVIMVVSLPHMLYLQFPITVPHLAFLDVGAYEGCDVTTVNVFRLFFWQYTNKIIFNRCLAGISLFRVGNNC